MKKRTRKKHHKSPTKAELRRQLRALQADTVAFRVVIRQGETTIGELRAALRRHEETTARAIAVVQEIAPALYLRVEDARRPFPLPDYMRVGRVRVPARVHRLWRPTDLPEGLDHEPLREAFVHRLSLELRDSHIDRATIFEFRNTPLCGASPMPGSCIQTHVSSDLLLQSRAALRFIFEELAEDLWQHFCHWLDKQKGIRA